MIENTKKEIRVAMYLRVSTDEQVKGYGLIYQEEKIRAYIKSQENHVLVESGIYTDEGYSGSYKIEERPALQKLFDDAKERKFDVVYVYRLDRWFRKTSYLLNAIERLNEINVGFKSITESFDTTTSTGRLVLTVLGGMAEMERETIRERTTNGRTSSARSGKWAVGMPPYGYIKDEVTKKLIIVEEEAKVVKNLYEWLIYEKMSLQKIAERINGMGINSPKHVMINKRKTNNYWYARTIGRILTNEIYTGVTYFRKYKRPFKNIASILDDNLKRPESEWIKIDVPAIISNDLFERAIKQLTSNRHNAARNTKRDYLYSKIIYCGKCGFKLFSRFQPPKKINHSSYLGTRYYSGVFRKENSVGSTKRCTTCPQYAESRLEPIWDCLKDILQNPHNLKIPLEKYKFKQEDKELIKSKLEVNNNKIKTLDTKIHKLAMLFVNNETMDIKEFKKLETDCSIERDKILLENRRLSQSILSKSDENKREVILKELYKVIKEKIDNATYADKKYIIHLFIESIKIHATTNTADVVFRFPNNALVTNTMSELSKQSTLLFISIKTLSEHERRVQAIKGNHLIYKSNITVK